jgi:ATP-dependent protease ClpP protease subunit
MPARAKIQEEIQRIKAAAQDEIRRKYLKKLSEYTKRDTILYMSGFTSIKAPQIPSTFLSITNEDIQGFMAALTGLKRQELDLILHSPGGSLEAAEQVVQYLRSKYIHIRAIVPQNAMSAATMIACACDEIIMGKQSAIGPIDPQITLPSPHGQFTAPAQSILDEFEEAKRSIINDPKTAPLWINRINMLPPGILDVCKNTIDNSVNKVAEWLDSYMFKDDKNKKGEEIASWLGNAREHKSHGRPIGLQLAQEIGLKVYPLENDQILQDLVLSVFHASAVTLDITPTIKFIENHLGKGWFLAAEIVQAPIPTPYKALNPTGVSLRSTPAG